MKALWVDENQDANYDLARRHGIELLFYSLQDQRVTRNYLNQVQNQGFGVGVYAVSGWGGYGHGAAFAEAINGRLEQLVDGLNDPRVQMDMEEHDPGLILAAIRRFRAIPGRKSHALTWTMESMQGGWMSPQFVQEITAHRVTVVPQYYGGNMQPFAQDVAYNDLLKRGFVPSQIRGFYDAAALPLNWDGFAFTMGRLPA